MTGARAITLALLLMASLPETGSPQQTRMVYGTVRDGGEVVRGAVVQLENSNSLDVRSFITQKDGEYHFAQLSTNIDYQIWAQRDDKRSPKKWVSKFDSSEKLRIDLTLK